jgi:hypothetical protein
LFNFEIYVERSFMPLRLEFTLNENTLERLWFSLYKNKSARKSMGTIKDMPKSMRKRKHAKEHDTKYKKMRENNGHSDARQSENNGCKDTRQ